MKHTYTTIEDVFGRLTTDAAIRDFAKVFADTIEATDLGSIAPEMSPVFSAYNVAPRRANGDDEAYAKQIKFAQAHGLNTSDLDRTPHQKAWITARAYEHLQSDQGGFSVVGFASAVSHMCSAGHYGSYEARRSPEPRPGR